MRQRSMSRLLTAAAAADNGAHALSFVVVLPRALDAKAVRQLSSSPFLKAQVVLAAAEHGYCDGAMHERQEPYRTSTHETTVFVLQTEKAARKWRADEKFERELRTAFAECRTLLKAAPRKREPREAPVKDRTKARTKAAATEPGEATRPESAKKRKRDLDADGRE